jgi:hypothetical protein
MEFRSLLLVALAAVASAGLPGNPKVFMSVDDTSLSGLESVGLKGSIDLDGIGDDSVKVSLDYDYNDLKFGPSTVSASVDRDIGDVAVNLGAVVNIADRAADITLTAKADGYSIVIEGDTSDPIPSSVGLSTSFDLGGTKVGLNPVVNVKSKEIDINADIDITSSASAHVEVNAMTQDATVEVSYDINDTDNFSPKWATGNKLSYGWTHKFSADSVLDVNYSPSDTVTAKWAEGDWTTQIDTPLASPGDSRVSFKRQWSL